MLEQARRWATTATVAAAAGAVSLVGAVPAAAGGTDIGDGHPTVVNCFHNSLALQPAIDGAAPGETLLVKGTCVGPFTFSVDKNLTVTGEKHAALNGNRAGSTVTVEAGVRLQLSHLTVINGTGTATEPDAAIPGPLGGGILNRGTLTVKEATVAGNHANNGGGIFNEAGATLNLIRSVVRHNTAADSGGGIRNQGTLTLSGSTLSDNSADNGGGLANFGSATLSGSKVRDNYADNGAGILNANALTLNHSTVSRNTASLQGGGIRTDGGTVNLTDSEVRHNTANGGIGSGGGIFNNGSTVTLDRSAVRDNRPDNCAPLGSVTGCTG
ncbi:hypothetical protein OG429_09865 [Streptomyces sp. NBC_00190]|uniref:hypothetical protein n=1 Tax=unclassified Streptomyces TaxID=2593676 RepID=UPI002E290611|nr:hypothetical protein [Streptomyces sp. NBC_00190]WSZ39623.1 hypothetical protein OG239_12870 [Streptomyces sp. NBC_00868]